MRGDFLLKNPRMFTTSNDAWSVCVSLSAMLPYTQLANRALPNESPLHAVLYPFSASMRKYQVTCVSRPSNSLYQALAPRDAPMLIVVAPNMRSPCSRG